VPAQLVRLLNPLGLGILTVLDGDIGKPIDEQTHGAQCQRQKQHEVAEQ
jgi:hypothetical protein